MASPRSVAGQAPRRSGLVLTTLALLLALHNANRFGVAGIFGPLRERFEGAYAVVGNLFSAYPLAYACSQIPAGLLADRVDPRRLIVIGTAGAMLAGVVFAFTDSYAVAFGARLVAGICGALIYTPAMTYGISAFPAAQRGAAIGVAYVGVGLGTAASLAAMPALVQAFGLTAALLSLAVFAAAMTALSPVGLSLQRPAAPRPRGRSAALLRDREFLCLLGYSFLGFLTIYAVLTWLPAYLTDALGVAPTTAGALAALANVSMTVSSPLVGKLSDVLPGRRRVLEIGAMASVVSFTVLATTQSLPLVVLASVLAGVSSAMTTAPMFVFAGERFGAGSAGLAVAMVNAIGQTGSSLSGVVFGFLLDWTGTFASIWWTCIPVGIARYGLLRAVSDPRPAGPAESAPAA